MTSVAIVDQELSEIGGLVDALLFIAEEADQERTESLRHSRTTILYIMAEKVRQANREVSRLCSKPCMNVQ